MKNPRTYGKSPFNLAVIHGGPGAGGEMAPVARELASSWGVLEPIQTATSLEGQVEELRMVLESYGDLPVALIGFSWGAWLSFIVAAHYPRLVKKLILIGSGPYEEKYVARLQEARLSRFSGQEGAEFEAIIRALGDPATEDRDRLLAQLGALAAKTDAYDPIMDESDALDSVGAQGDVFQPVWQEAAELRRSGKLLAIGKQIRCPAVAIHGNYDPHPAEGVQKPLSAILKNFRFIRLKNCGHKPWIERGARDEFYAILKEELRSGCLHGV
jgi:pimeloyl-ACP methyl ester carboxylesterase